MNKLMSLFFALGVISNQAMADAGSRFTWSLNSSDDKMYVCGAGFRHINAIQSNGDLVSRTTAVAPHDYIETKYVVIGDDMVEGPLTYARFEAHNGVGAWPADWQLSIDWSQITWFKTKVKDLNFNFTSEHFGVEMYVDVCYRGPQVDFLTYQIPSSSMLSKNEITFTDTSPAFNDYANKADLEVTSYTVCDTQRTGTRQGPTPSVNDITNLYGSDQDSTHRLSSQPNNNYVNIGQGVNTVNFIPSGAVNLNGPVGIYDAPSFCITTYLMRENSTAERPWGLRRGQFTTKTEILNNQ